jgi:hypothetical protein
MPLKESTLRQQLTRAKARLGEVEEELGQGVVPKKDALWRQANARVLQIEERMTSRSAIVSGTATGAPKPDEQEEAEEKGE